MIAWRAGLLSQSRRFSIQQIFDSTRQLCLRFCFNIFTSQYFQGNKVNKLENIKEYNEEISEALELAFQLMNAKVENYEDFVNLKYYLQKLAIKNHITGNAN